MAAAIALSEAAKPGHVYELPQSLTRRYLGSGRFARIGVIGDGSCFYHSVCSMLNLDSYRSAPDARQRAIVEAFRCKFNDSLDKRKFATLVAGTSTGKTYEATREALCKPAVWADEVMIKLASSVLNMNLIFLDLSAQTLYCGVHGEETLKKHKKQVVQGLSGLSGLSGGGKGGKEGYQQPAAFAMQPTAVIVWVNRMHFEPLVRIDGVDEKAGAVHLTRIFEPTRNAADTKVVTALMSSYLDECPDV